MARQLGTGSRRPPDLAGPRTGAGAGLMRAMSGSAEPPPPEDGGRPRKAFPSPFVAAAYHVALTAIVLEYALGMAISLYASFPGTSEGDNWAYAWTSGGLVAAHIVLALIILVAAAALLWLAVVRGDAIAARSSAAVLLFTLLAAGFGSAFVGSQTPVWSYLMALSFIPVLVVCTSGRPLHSMHPKATPSALHAAET